MALFAKNRSFFGLFCTALFLLFVISLLTPAIAGEYHATEIETSSGASTLACSQCHTMHGSQGGASMIYAGQGSGIQPKLLRASTIMKLCLYCHDGDPAGLGAPDIKGTTTQTYIPSAGRFSDQSYDNYANMHDIELSAPTPPGYTAGAWASVTTTFSSTFNCIYCHDQHGNQNYRNLRYDPGDTSKDTLALGVKVNYRMSGQTNCSDDVADVRCDVEQTVAAGIGLNKYARSSVTFRRLPLDADNYKRGVAAWCGRCHGDFYGKSVDANMGGVAGGDPGAGDTNTGSPWKRHPVQDISLATTNMHTDLTLWTPLSVEIVRRVDADAAITADADDQPLCLSCHYAHGGGNPNNIGDPSLDHSNLVYLDAENDINMTNNAAYGASGGADATLYNSGSGYMRNTCQKCHNQ